MQYTFERHPPALNHGWDRIPGIGVWGAIALAAGFASAGETGPNPVPEQLQTVLILDEKSVADADGVTFHLNQAQKHPENPVLMPGRPSQWDGLQVTWPGT